MVYPKYPNRDVLKLDGIWEFTFSENEASLPSLYDQLAAVPGVFDNNPDQSAGRRGVGFYKRTFVATSTNMLICLHGLGLWGAVYVDGVKIGVIDLPYTGMEFEFATTIGEHELVIAVDNRLHTEETTLFAQFYDYYGHGGLYRSVEIHPLPMDFALNRAHVSTLDLDGNFNVKLYFSGKTTASKVKFSYSIDCGEEQELEQEFVDGHIEFNFNNKLSLWSTKSPNLHFLTIKMGEDILVERFGARIVEVDGINILLNGEKLQLRGFCRHETHAQFGPALPDAILLEDITILKELNCNFVRGSHYAQDPRFLALCDSVGILVWEEGIGWGDGVDRLTNPIFQERQIRQYDWIIRNSFNNPSIIMRGFLNEGLSNAPESCELYAKLAKKIKELDPTRPTTFASNHIFDELNFDLVDIISINTYPGWYAGDVNQNRPLNEIEENLSKFCAHIADKSYGDKPLIISEIGAGGIYGWRDRFHSHWSEEYQRDFLNEVCRVINSNPRICGLALWQFCDGRTYSTSLALGRPRAFNNKGIIDEYRRPKLAFETVAEHFKNITKC